MDRYKVVERGSAQALSEEVGYLLSEGWLLVGGVDVTFKNVGGVTGYLYCQAMILSGSGRENVEKTSQK